MTIDLPMKSNLKKVTKQAGSLVRNRSQNISFMQILALKSNPETKNNTAFVKKFYRIAWAKKNCQNCPCTT